MMIIKVRHFLGIPLAIGIVVASYYLLLESNKNLFIFLCVLSFIISLLPFMMGFLASQKEQKEKEEKFLEFTRDLVEGVKSGTPINKSIINLQTRDYGALTKHIKKLANQVYFGINLEQAFSTFAKETRSKVIARAVMLISEAQKAGGRIESIVQSVSSSVNQIQDLEKERKSSVYNLIIQGYIIFFVFIIIMLVLEYAILPLATEFSENRPDTALAPGTKASSSGAMTKEQFSTPLFVLLIVQALFAGLVIGKVSEGSVLSGIKHSFLLTTVTLLAVTGTRAVLG